MRRWTGIWPLCGVPLPPAAKEPGLRDIVGGLGWIMGLVGIGLYFSRRRP